MSSRPVAGLDVVIGHGVFVALTPQAPNGRLHTRLPANRSPNTSKIDSWNGDIRITLLYWPTAARLLSPISFTVEVRMLSALTRISSQQNCVS
jgi:hypothetical protein